MAIKITDECINCGACEPECPNNAIYEGGAEWRFSDGTTVKGMVTKLDGGELDANAPQEPKAMDYYYFVKEAKDATKDLETGTFQSFIISSENYSTFYKDKNIDEYQTFFSQNFK